mgnify:CR=1 FL=1
MENNKWPGKPGVIPVTSGKADDANVYNRAFLDGIHVEMLMYGKEASNRKQEIDRQHYTIPNQRPKDKHCGKI